MGDKAEKIREKEGSVSINFAQISSGENAAKFSSNLKNGIFWGFAIITFGLPVLLLKTWKDFMQIEEKEEE